MADGGRRRGPARRRWASMGVLAKVLTVAVALVIGFVALGGVLEACGAGSKQGPLQTPTGSSSPATSPTSRAPVSPTPKTKDEPSRPAVTVTQTTTASEEPAGPTTSSPQSGAYYDNCDAARAAGAAPLHRGDPGYRDELDRDGDGVACEPYR